MLLGRMLRCRFRREIQMLDACVESNFCSSIMRIASSGKRHLDGIAQGVCGYVLHKSMLPSPENMC